VHFLDKKKSLIVFFSVALPGTQMALLLNLFVFYILKVFFINIFKLKYNNYQTLNATMLAQTA